VGERRTSSPLNALYVPQDQLKLTNCFRTVDEVMSSFWWRRKTGTQTGHEFLNAKGFCQVIICPLIKGGNLSFSSSQSVRTMMGTKSAHAHGDRLQGHPIRGIMISESKA